MSNIPSNFDFVQQESVQFNQPVSEASLSAMGGAINGMLTLLLPVGSIIGSMLTEVQFQAQLGNPVPATWILSDGRDITGTALQLLTSQTNAPDLRGVFTRGKNNGRSDGDQNPDGDLALGTYTADKFLSHIHYESVVSGIAPGPTIGGFSTPSTETNKALQTLATGGNETAPKNVTINYFIRIN